LSIVTVLLRSQVNLPFVLVIAVTVPSSRGSRHRRHRHVRLRRQRTLYCVSVVVADVRASVIATVFEAGFDADK
jgi:hypothetical protein